MGKYEPIIVGVIAIAAGVAVSSLSWSLAVLLNLGGIMAVIFGIFTRADSSIQRYVRCPQCDERIRRKAKVCRHCGSVLM